jgi:hypothetical protein
MEVTTWTVLTMFINRLNEEVSDYLLMPNQQFFSSITHGENKLHLDDDVCFVLTH